PARCSPELRRRAPRPAPARRSSSDRLPTERDPRSAAPRRTQPRFARASVPTRERPPPPRLEPHAHVALPRLTGNGRAMDDEFERLLDTMKLAGGTLNDAEIPWALGGGLACWARGAPETEHDVDFLVRPEDAERAQQALAERGFK